MSRSDDPSSSSKTSSRPGLKPASVRLKPRSAELKEPRTAEKPPSRNTPERPPSYDSDFGVAMLLRPVDEGSDR
jgi:hypothetical protein